MQEAETPQENRAHLFFSESIGLEVIRIPTAPTPTADYFVNGDGPGYVVEVKSRNDEATLADRLEQGEAVDGERPLAHDAALERVVRSARKQFREGDPNHGRLWVLWVSLDAVFGSDAAFEQCVGTFYGIRQCLLPDENGKALSVDCYYARPGVFERWPEIDAAVIASDQGVMMVANELSPRFTILRDREVPRRLGKAFYRPSEREADGTVFIADREPDREDEGVLRERLRRKYGKEVRFIIDLKHTWAAMKTPRTSG